LDNKVVLIGTSPITFNVLEGKGKYVFDTLIIQTSMEVIKMVKPLESKKTPEMNLKVEMTENRYFVLCYYDLDWECEQRLEQPDANSCAQCRTYYSYVLYLRWNRRLQIHIKQGRQEYADRLISPHLP
jgi:hypothetical protein